MCPGDRERFYENGMGPMDGGGVYAVVAAVAAWFAWHLWKLGAPLVLL